MSITSSDPDSAVSGAAEELLSQYRATGDRAVRNRVVEDHRWLAVAISTQYRHRGALLDDLIQVGLLGIVKAAERFDPAFGVEFKTYAAITARGEIRRHFRDAGWAVRVPRRLQELRYEIRAANELLAARLHRSPTTAELAEHLLVTTDEIIDCLCADSNYRSLSLEAIVGDDGARGTAADGLDDVDAQDAFDELITRLPSRLRRVMVLRYVDGMKQSEVAAELGVSQVQVSRLQRRALGEVRVLLEARRGTPDAVPTGSDPVQPAIPGAGT